MLGGWQADRVTRTVLALLTVLTTVMCLPDHFDFSTWPFTLGYILLYATTLVVVARMGPADTETSGRDADLPESRLGFRDLPASLRSARLLTAGLVLVLGALYAPHWLHSPRMTGAVSLAAAMVVVLILMRPGTARLGGIATAALFLFIISSPLEYTNHEFFPDRTIAVHVTVASTYLGLLAASLLPVRVRWILVFVLVVGTLLRVESLVQWPMDPMRRDMPVLMNHGIQSLLDGRFPYRIYFCSHDVPQTYLPVLYLTHLPFVALGLDMRWGQLLATLITAVVIWDWGRGSRGLREVGLYLAILFYLMPETVWSVVHAEPPAYWMWGALAFWGFIHRRYLLAALFFGITLGTRHFAYLMVPFAIVWYASVVRSRKEALLYLLVAACVASVILMPFALEGPIPFLFGTLHWLTKFGETHRTWWHIYISFAPLFYAMEWEKWLLPIQISSFVAILLASVVMEVRTARRSEELHGSWRPWWFMTMAYMCFLMFNSIIWRYLHVMPIVNLAFMVALRLQNRVSEPGRGHPRVTGLVNHRLAYPVVASVLGVIFASSLAYMGWAWSLSRDRESVEAHAADLQTRLRPGDMLVDSGLFNAWPVMEGAVFDARDLPPDVRYVIRLRSQFPPAFKRVIYLDGTGLFDPDRDVPDLRTYMKLTGIESRRRSTAYFFENPRPVKVTWRLSQDPDRILRSELTALPAGVAIGQRKRNARFFFEDAAPPGYYSGWRMIRSMFHQWTCVLAHPPGEGREIRLYFYVPSDGQAWLATGLDDYAIWASRPPVNIHLDGPGLDPGGVSFVHPNEQGHYVWSLGEIQAGEFQATVTSTTHRQRMFCFDVALGEPAGPHEYGISRGLGM